MTVNISFFNIDVVAAYYLAVFGCFGCYCMQLAAVYCVSRISGYCACCYTGNLTVLIEGNLAVNYGIAILHVNRCALTVNHTCNSCCTIQCQFSITIGNSVAGYVDICQFCTLISIYAIFGCNVASSFDSTVGTADAYIFASQIAKHDILVHVNLVELLTVNISFFNIDVVAAYYLAVFGCFGCYCMQLAAVYCVSRISGYCACCYAGNLAVFSNSYFAKLSTFSGDLAVVAACIAYIQLAVTQCGIFIEYAIFQNYVADFAFGCGYFAVFIYNQFAVCSIECAVAVYEERRSTICFCSTYCYTACCYTAACPDSAFAAADAYHCVIIAEKMNIVIQSNIIFLATVRIIFWGYSNVVTCGNSTVFEYFCCRIISHCRSHACTGHNTCCNQHCQQLFGRAAFTAMIFCDFGDNNVCVARLTPNYFEYFVHQ